MVVASLACEILSPSCEKFRFEIVTTLFGMMFISTRYPKSGSHKISFCSKAQIKRALQGNFLFEGLTERQRHTLIDCMDLLEVNAGDVIIRQVKIFYYSCHERLKRVLCRIFRTFEFKF